MKLENLFAAGFTAWALAGAVSAGDPGTGEWPMWGGTPDRNMVAEMPNAPVEWDVKTKKNIVWVAALGSQTYGNPVVAGGKVFVGTNNEHGYDPKLDGDRGVLMAFDVADGRFLWQHATEKLKSGRVNDWPYQGVASSPLVSGDRLWYVSNRGELLCLDTEGFHDGENDGPVTSETLTGKSHADIVWRLDMMETLGVHQHNLANSSPVMYENLVFISTANGQDESHVNIPSPRAPALIAVDKTTGEVLWEDNSVGGNILHGQWSTPTVGEIGGVLQVVHAQGDGWVRGFNWKTGEKLWEFDTNPKDSVWPKDRNELIATPVIYKDRVYIANGQDPEHGEGVGHMYAIDATQRGDLTTAGRIWHYDKIRRSISTAAIKDDIVYITDFSGFFHALDANSGKPYWVHDLLAAVWASPMVVGDRVYVGDEDGDIVVMQAGQEQKLLAEMNMGSSVYCSVVPAGGALYVANRNQLVKIAAP